MAEDIEVLERYLTPRPTADGGAVKQYKLISSTKGGPVVYLTVARSRKGLPAASSAGNAQREIIEQILGPAKDAGIGVYFDKIHPCFPVIDERTFWELWQRDPAKISSSLVCDIYAISIVFWRTSPALCGLPQPDMSFIWNLAVTASQEDFMGPSMSTMHAALLDLAGRPVLGIQSNVVNCGRVVMLAHSLGLHRNPAAWRATQHEKNMRVRLWWGVRIHDSWASLAHGTPPLIREGCHDVPIPSLSSVREYAPSMADQDAFESFLALCGLTQILSGILPLIYAVDDKEGDVAKAVRRFECALDEWEDELSRSLRNLRANGSASLWFCYLSLRLLACRLSLRAVVRHSNIGGAEARQYWLSMLRSTAVRVADFVASLTKAQSEHFWLSYTSHLLVSATTMLLRCTIETEAVDQRQLCVRSLSSMFGAARHAKHDWHWDLADMMLERCSEAIGKVVDLVEDGTRNAQGQEAGSDRTNALHKANVEHSDTHQPTASSQSLGDLDDLLLPSDSLDLPWETMWDGIMGPWPTEL